jgi:hypothetical protein
LSVSVPVLSEQIADVEPLHRPQPLHDRALRRERLRPERQHRGHHRGQAGRDRGDREADADDEDVVEVLAADEAEEDHERQRDAGHGRDQHRELVELARERRLLLLDRAEHARDLSDLGRHAGRGDDHLAAAARDGRVHVGHVDAVAERDVVARHGVDGLADGRALAGERRLLDLERRGDAEAPVRRDLVARLEGHDVAGHELLGGQVHRLAAPAHVPLDEQHLLERRDALGRLALLVEAEDRVQDGQGEDHDARRPLLQGDDADDRGAEEHELHEVAVLAQERVPARLRLGLGELVRPDLRAAAPDLGVVEARRGVDVEARARLVGGERVPRGLVDGDRRRPLALGSGGSLGQRHHVSSPSSTTVALSRVSPRSDTRCRTPWSSAWSRRRPTSRVVPAPRVSVMPSKAWPAMSLSSPSTVRRYFRAAMPPSIPCAAGGRGAGEDDHLGDFSSRRGIRARPRGRRRPRGS